MQSSTPILSPDGHTETWARSGKETSGRPPLPKIPREFFNRSPVGAATFLLYALALWSLPAAGIYDTAVASSPGWGWKVLMILLLALVAQQGLHLLGWIGHESFHFNMFSGKRINVATGLIFSSMIVGHNGFGFALSHWHHHRFTNQPEDPDWQIFTRFVSPVSRFFFARLAADEQYFRNGLLAAFGRWKGDMRGFPLSSQEIRKFARYNLALSFFWICVYGWIIFRHPAAGLLSVGLPLFLVTLFTGLRPYLEHAGTDKGLFTTSRTRTSPILSLFYFFNNYHLEHHLYPRVPCYNLPRLHRWLASTGLLKTEGALVEDRFFNNLQYVSSRYQYPDSSPRDESRHTPGIRPDSP